MTPTGSKEKSDYRYLVSYWAVSAGKWNTSIEVIYHLEVDIKGKLTTKTSLWSGWKSFISLVKGPMLKTSASQSWEPW